MTKITIELSEPQEIPTLTFDEIAAYMGVSRARVFQLHKRALEKIGRKLQTDSEARELCRDVLGVSRAE